MLRSRLKASITKSLGLIPLVFVSHLPAQMGGTLGNISEVGPRLLPLLVYDSTRDRLVLYGGQLDAGGRPGVDRQDVDPKTYAWNGSQWAVIADKGPVSRDEMAFGMDTRSGNILMSGGRSNGPGQGGPMRVALRETWRFDGSQWTLADTSGPEGRSSPAGAFDTARGTLVVFGGASGHTGGRGPLATDTWEWNGTSWKRFDVPGPPGRTGHVMAYDSKSGLVIMHGGIRSVDRVALTDTWGWNGERWILLTMEGPRSIYGAAASAPDSGIVIFGGHTLSGSNNSTWHWTGRTWKTVATDGPSARTFPALATDAARKRVYMLGGMSPSDPGITYRDLWYLDANFRWVRLYAD